MEMIMSVYQTALEQVGIEVTLCLTFGNFKSYGICCVELQIVIAVFRSSVFLSNVSYCLLVDMT